MDNKKRKVLRLSACLWMVILVVSSGGCQLQRGLAPGHETAVLETGKIVVFGFKPALRQGSESGVIRSPLSGAVFYARPVPQLVTDNLTEGLFERIVEREGYELVSPGQARGVFERIVSESAELGDIEIFQRIGRAFSADAVMAGYVYRWIEREGADYSVSRPASAAFDLYLIRPDDGRILWKGKFDKTQTSLSENILDVGTFIKGKGKWMTVGGLAELGLAEVLRKSPLKGEVKEKTKE